MSLEYYTPNFDKNIYFVSDIHGFHKNICKGTSTWTGKDRCRDFEDEVKMTEFVVNKINAKVKRDDILINLGDWSFGGKDKIQRLRDMINCENVILLLGNHDTKIRENPEYQKLFTKVLVYNEFRYKGILVCQMHYPIGSWNEIGRGSWCLHAHCHGSYQVPGKILDVGIDNENTWTSLGYDGYPLHIDEIYQIMQEKELHLVDHHGVNTSYG